MSTHQPIPQDYPVIPLDTLSHFFCVGFDGAYRDTFDKGFTIDPHCAMMNILHFAQCDELVAVLNNAKEKEGYQVSCISGKDGSCFLTAAIPVNGHKVHIFSSAIIFHHVINGEEKHLIAPQFLLAGLAVPAPNGQMNFVPHIAHCRAIINDNDDQQMISATGTPEFYASLCYGQMCLATCLAGKMLDLETNQSWLDVAAIPLAYKEFTNTLGLMTVADVVADYEDRMRSAAEILAKLGSEDEDYPEDAPASPKP